MANPITEIQNLAAGAQNEPLLSANITALLYTLAAVLFIVATRSLASPETARRGNLAGMVGMVVAVVTTLTLLESSDSLTWGLIILGLVIGGGIGGTIALKIPMTAMPQFVAMLNALVGLSAVTVAWAAWVVPAAFHIGLPGAINVSSIVEMSFGVAIGAVTFSGSMIAFAKLNGNMSGAPIILKGRHFVNASMLGVIIGGIIWICLDPSHQTTEAFLIITALSFLIGILIIIPIGGADMPVVVSMLNSYSGFAGVGVGFTLHNMALIITGALVGSSGAILSYIMCKAMNRSFFSVIMGGFGVDDSAAVTGVKEDRPVKQGSAADAAFIMKNASHVIIVPGYGMAVAQAQHAVKELTEELKGIGVKVSFAIHPVAGRMPGHMNVLLAEAGVSYDEVFELEQINNEFPTAQVAFVIGANDVTNPAAKTDSSSPIYGMPILDVERAQTVLFVKRGMSSGYAGVDNELFFRDNTMMLFSDAKKMVEEIIRAL